MRLKVKSMWWAKVSPVLNFKVKIIMQELL